MAGSTYVERARAFLVGRQAEVLRTTAPRGGRNSFETGGDISNPRQYEDQAGGPKGTSETPGGSSPSEPSGVLGVVPRRIESPVRGPTSHPPHGPSISVPRARSQGPGG